jgi:ATP-dependent Clp protease protease subunit
MKCILTAFLLLCLSGVDASWSTPKQKLIELQKDNFVSLRQAIDGASVARVIYQLNAINTTPIFLYINSPGGSVLAGLEIINYVKSLQVQNREVHCICNRAMSMAFVLFQHCTKRYIMYGSTLMQHQMSLSDLTGKLYDLNSQMTYYNRIEQELNAAQAKRLNLDVSQFVEKTQHDWWLYSGDILTWQAADEMVVVTCAFQNYEENVTHVTIFGNIEITYSACPLISKPLKITFPSIFTDTKKDEYLVQIQGLSLAKSGELIL